MSDTEWKHVGLKVEQSQYDDWEDYLEGSDYGSMSNLIRTAVEREIARDSPVGAADAAQTGGVDVTGEHIAEVVDTVNSMQDRMERLEDTVSDAARSMRVGGSVSEDTTTAVWRAVPEGVEQATTAEGVAAGTDVDTDTARVALEQLAENTPSVHRVAFEDLGEAGDDGTVTATWNGREVPIEGARDAVKRRNPLFFKEV
jgi:hypothetical protein